MQHRPFEIPLVKERDHQPTQLYDTLLCLFLCTARLFGRVGLLRMEEQEFLDKTGRKLADTRGPIMPALVLLIHIL